MATLCRSQRPTGKKQKLEGRLLTQEVPACPASCGTAGEPGTLHTTNPHLSSEASLKSLLAGNGITHSEAASLLGRDTSVYRALGTLRWRVSFGKSTGFLRGHLPDRTEMVPLSLSSR